MTQNLNRALSRLGEEVLVYSRSNVGSEDAFGQEEKSWSQDRTTLAVRSYQNRNTTMNSGSGELNRDRPIFFFPVDDYPSSGERIEYRGQYYELDQPTKHRTHAVAPASIVRDDNFPP